METHDTKKTLTYKESYWKEKHYRKHKQDMHPTIVKKEGRARIVGTSSTEPVEAPRGACFSDFAALSFIRPSSCYTGFSTKCSGHSNY